MGCDESLSKSKSKSKSSSEVEQIPLLILKPYGIRKKPQVVIKRDIIGISRDNPGVFKGSYGPALIPRAFRQQQLQRHRLLFQNALVYNAATPKPSALAVTTGIQAEKPSVLKRLHNLNLSTDDSSSSTSTPINTLIKDDLSNSSDEQGDQR